MKYRNDRNGNPLSILGFGCMRFPKKMNKIDQEEVNCQIGLAYEKGVNYFDTAYIYPGSEAAMGNALEALGIREKVNIATKLPQYLLRKKEQFEKYFDEELRRLKTDYIDYYLMHMMSDIVQFENLENLGFREWVKAKKASGAIKNIGFSFHGSYEMFEKILNAYDWDFTMIQYNYYDENHQAGKAGLKAAAEKGIPVIIMEPLRGGKLVNLLPEGAKHLIKENPRHRTPAEWSLRWLWNQPEVTCVLSGMNSQEMISENTDVADSVEVGDFTDEDFAFIAKLCRAINEKMKVDCTACRYCMPCLAGVDIPGIFNSWNVMHTENKFAGLKEFFMTVGLGSKPGFATQCVKCGKCEKVCPQNIPIIELLTKADRALRPLYMKAAIEISRKFMVRKRSKKEPPSESRN